MTTADFIGGNASIWISDPGIGKSDSVVRLKKWMLKTFPGKRLGFSTIFMAVQSPLGFTGLPWKGQLVYNGKTYTITDPAIPQWFLAFDLVTGELAPADQFDRVLLVIEEWGQGDLETKRAGADVLLHGASGNFRLPRGSFRLALSNSSARDGITKEIDLVINRRAEKHITGDVDIWREDFAELAQDDGHREWFVMPITKTWAMQNPTVPIEAKPKEQGPWCTFRSLTMWDRFAQVCKEQNNGALPLDDPAFIESTHGYIGAPAGKSLLSTCEYLENLPSLEDVVSDPTGTEVPIRADLVMLMMYELASRVQPDDVGPVLQYVGRVKQQDMHIAFVKALLRRDYVGIVNLPPMAAWIEKNKRLVGVIGSFA